MSDKIVVYEGKKILDWDEVAEIVKRCQEIEKVKIVEYDEIDERFAELVVTVKGDSFEYERSIGVNEKVTDTNIYKLMYYGGDIEDVLGDELKRYFEEVPGNWMMSFYEVYYKCRVCSGEGVVDFVVEGEYVYAEGRCICPVCDGDGVIYVRE